MRFSRCTSLLSALVVSGTLLLAQSVGTGGASLASDDRSPFFNNLSIDPVGPGDLLYLSVSNWAEVTRTYRVGKDGIIELPLVKQSIRVAGLNAYEIGKKIAALLTSENILIHPLVTANVVEYRSRTVEVTGAVHHPVTFQALGQVRLLDAIARAEGVSSEAGPEVLIARLSSSSSQSTVEHISLKRLIEGSQPFLNRLLLGGEQIRIPRAGKLYILGNVRTPGAYSLNEEGVSVLKALALSGGPLPFSQSTAVLFRTTEGSRKREEIAIPFKAMVKHHAPDLELQANDILYVPDNSGRKITSEILDKLSGFGSSTVSGLLIFH